jgi:phosphatidylethanolamine-binding protein (PEBP) family uncharacterized protein
MFRTIGLAALVYCNNSPAENKPAQQTKPVTFTIASPSFLAGEDLPRQFTCDGEGVEPSLAFVGFPTERRASRS